MLELWTEKDVMEVTIKSTGKKVKVLNVEATKKVLTFFNEKLTGGVLPLEVAINKCEEYIKQLEEQEALNNHTDETVVEEQEILNNQTDETIVEDQTTTGEEPVVQEEIIDNGLSLNDSESGFENTDDDAAEQRFDELNKDLTAYLDNLDNGSTSLDNSLNDAYASDPKDESSSNEIFNPLIDGFADTESVDLVNAENTDNTGLDDLLSSTNTNEIKNETEVSADIHEQNNFEPKAKYASLIKKLLVYYKDTGLTKESLTKFMIGQGNAFPHAIFNDELGEEIFKAFETIRKKGSELSLIDIQLCLTQVKIYYNDLTKPEIVKYISDAIEHGNIKDALKFVEKNCSDEDFENYKYYLYVNLKNRFVDKNCELYELRNNNVPFYFEGTMIALKKYSGKLYNYVVSNLSQDIIDAYWLNPNVKVDVKDVYFRDSFEAYDEKYRDEIDETREVDEQPNYSFDADMDPIRFGDSSTETAPNFLYENDGTPHNDEEPEILRNINNSDEDIIEFRRMGKMYKIASRVSLCAAGLSGLITIAATKFGVNLKSVYFSSEYGKGTKILYTLLLASIGLSCVLYNKFNKEKLEFEDLVKMEEEEAALKNMNSNNTFNNSDYRNTDSRFDQSGYVKFNNVESESTDEYYNPNVRRFKRD